MHPEGRGYRHSRYLSDLFHDIVHEVSFILTPLPGGQKAGKLVL